MTTVDASDAETVAVPPFDPDLAGIFASLAGMAPMGLSLTLERIYEMRAMFESTPVDLAALSRGGRMTIEDVSVPGLDGEPDVILSVFRPVATTGRAGCLYFLHGGGMVIGNRFTGIDDLVDWALELDLVLVSAEYRLAPEHPDPAPVHDAYAGMQGLSGIADRFEIDLARLVAVGTSAGGGLAAGATLMARDRATPPLAGQLLMCPMLDDRFRTASSRMLAEGAGVWDRDSNELGWTALLGDRRGTQDVSAYAAPARASDVSGLPPTFLDVGTVETFRDEVVELADRIWQAGGAAELHVWPGGFHGFDMIVPAAPISQDARNARLQWLRRLFGTP